MNLTEKQLKVQEAMLLRLHPGKSLEEAYAVECPCEGLGYIENYIQLGDDWYEKERDSCNPHSVYPSSLSRVLTALGNGYIFTGKEICKVGIQNINGGVYYIGKKNCVETIGDSVCIRKPLNEYGSDCNLWQQSSETQDAISKLLGVE